MDKSEMFMACETIAEIIITSDFLPNKGEPIQMFIDQLDSGETPRMAAVIVKELLINDNDLSGEG